MTVEVKVIAEKLVCPLLRVWKRGQCDTIVLEQDEVGSKQSRWGERKEKKKKKQEKRVGHGVNTKLTPNLTSSQLSMPSSIQEQAR